MRGRIFPDCEECWCERFPWISRYYRQCYVTFIFHTPTPPDALEIVRLSGRGDRMKGLKGRGVIRGIARGFRKGAGVGFVARMCLISIFHSPPLPMPLRS